MKENDIKEGFWVFVSHSTKDFEKVRLVRNALEDGGFRPILFYLKCMEDEDEINELLKREIDARRRFILCDSPNARASKFVKSEVDYIQSKKRMYEIIDLSQINLETPNAERDIIRLIKPFKRRTSVFLSYNYKDKAFADQLHIQLQSASFKTADADFFGPWPGNAPVEDFDILIKNTIKATLDEGYVIGLISNNTGFNISEMEYAYKIEPLRVLPVIIDDFDKERLPKNLRIRDVLNVAQISSTTDKAKSIVEKLISLDIKNQYK